MAFCRSGCPEKAACTSLELHQQKKKEDDEDNEAGRQDEVETFTNGVAAKNSSLNEVGLCRWYGDRIELVWRSAGIAGRLCFLPCCKEYCSFTAAAV